MSLENSEVRMLSTMIDRAVRATGPKVQLVVRKVAKDIVRDAKLLAPVDTGNLKNSITHSDLRSIGYGGGEVEIGPTANYGYYMEHGTSRVAPQPFMGPAADNNVGNFEQAMAQIAEEALGG